MSNSTTWSVMNVRLAQFVPWAIVTATITFASLPDVAHAAGTNAGTTISNTATATYNDPSGNPQITPSNTIDIVVDELLDVTLVANDPGDVPTVPGATNQVLSFTVTNTGNGNEAFVLTPNSALGGDQFNPTTTSIVLDTNNNGVYDAGVDTVYTTGSSTPVLAPDASLKVFVLSTIPGGATDGDRGLTNLTAAALTGTGAPGTSFAGQGDLGSDAVVGTTGADSVDDGAYVVQSATIGLNKSATIANPFGGTDAVPGSIVTYTLVATISGTGSLNNIAIGDAIPANTTYQTGTLTLQGAALTDASDADVGEFGSNAISVRLGNLPGGGTIRTVTFKVRIN